MDDFSEKLWTDCGPGKCIAFFFQKFMTNILVGSALTLQWFYLDRKWPPTPPPLFGASPNFFLFLRVQASPRSHSPKPLKEKYRTLSFFFSQLDNWLLITLFKNTDGYMLTQDCVTERQSLPMLHLFNPSYSLYSYFSLLFDLKVKPGPQMEAAAALPPSMPLCKLDLNWVQL